MLPQSIFNPDEHGFHFANLFNSIPVPRVIQSLTKKKEIPFSIFGLCGGMCYTALDFYYTKTPIPPFSSVKEIPTSLWNYLFFRQMDSLYFRDFYKYIKFTYSGDSILQRYVREISLVQIKEKMLSNQPIVLGLIRTHFLKSLTRNHQVIVTGISEVFANQSVLLTIYDPNYPLKSETISIQLSPELKIIHSTGEIDRGFFVMNYQIKIPFDWGYKGL
jgi:hypothetical protein